MPWCLKSACSLDCGTRKHPSSANRMLSRALLLFLVAVLVASLWVGLKTLYEDKCRAAVTMPVSTELALCSVRIEQSLLLQHGPKDLPAYGYSLANRLAAELDHFSVLLRFSGEPIRDYF